MTDLEQYRQPIELKQDHQIDPRLLAALLTPIISGAPKGSEITIKIENSFNTTKQTYTEQAAQLQPVEYRVSLSRSIPWIFAGFWLICMAVLLGIALDEN
jgi:hypothetical protein